MQKWEEIEQKKEYLKGYIKAKNRETLIKDQIQQLRLGMMLPALQGDGMPRGSSQKDLYIAACLRDNYPYERRQFYLTKPKWEPVFEPDAAALSSYGDGAIKINQAIPGYITQDKMKDFTGI